MNKPLPKKIDPCPIIESLVEVRFETLVPTTIVFGSIFNEFRKDFQKIEELPIRQLPADILENDVNYAYVPHYKLSNNDFILQIGPKVLSVTRTKEYVGWGEFKRIAVSVFNRLNALGVVAKYNRLAIRYINFFEHDIYDNIELKIINGSSPLKGRNTIIRSEIEEEGFVHILQIANDTFFTKGDIQKKGSFIDIETTITTGIDASTESFETHVEKAHSLEKQFLFNLLTNEFIETLNPVY